MLWIINHLVWATVLMVGIALALVIIIYRVLIRFYHHETRASFGSTLASIVIAVFLSVILNHEYAEKRDRDNRLRSIRDQHYAQLKPALRTESSKLADLASMVERQAYLNIDPVFPYGGAKTDFDAMLWPDVLSPDLAHHFAHYDQSKHDLLAQMRVQDQEFGDTVRLLEKDIDRQRRIDHATRRIVAMSYVEKCVGRGNGVLLRVTETSFSFEYWGASTGGGGKPSADQVAAFRLFETLKPSPSVGTHCVSLKSRANAIRDDAEALSKEAQLLSEGTLLTGTCEYITSRTLSD